MIDMRIIANMQRVLAQEPDETRQAATLILLNLTFVMNAADFDVGHARKLLIELHHKALETITELEQDEKRLRH